MSKSKQTFTGGADMQFHGDTGKIIQCWQISPVFALDGKPESSSCNVEGFAAANIRDWRAARINDDGLLDEPLPGHSMVWLKTFVYARHTREFLLEHLFDTMLLNFETFVDGKKIFQPEARMCLSLPLPCLWIPLRKGWNELAIKLTAHQGQVDKTYFRARIIEKTGDVLGPEYFSVTGGPAPDLPPAPAVAGSPCRQNEKVLPASAAVTRRENDQDLTAEHLAGFKPGIGAGIKSAGRFGFAKGDGILDCSMPFLGLIAKPYIFGHPQYRKSIMWHFNLMPPGIPEKDRYAGKRSWDTYKPGDNEQIDVNWISVRWRKQLIAEADFYHRRRGQTINFACSYSIASPGILVETNDAALRLGGMELAGSCDSIILPLQKGRTIRSGHDGLAYDRQRDGAFTDNWILLWGNNSFPDVPIMLALQKNPEKIVFNRNALPSPAVAGYAKAGDGILDSIDIVAAGEFGLAAVVFPFGFEVFKPEETGGDAWIETAVAKCAFLSKAVLAYPSDCQEYFKIAREKDRIEIIQKFDYRIINDEWGSKPIRTAPLPPPLSLIEDVGQVRLDDAAEDFGFPTKYGYLKGVIGRNWSSYSLPLPPTRRKFCLKPEGDNHIASLIGADFDEYLRFHRSSEKIPNPGVYQFIIQYAIPLLLFNFLDDKERRTLEKITGEGVRKGASPATEYTHTSGKRCCSWYKRTEPYTGVDYLMTYLHISGINNLNSCDRESIESHQQVFNEVDWGNGFALYSLYLGALLSGNWQSIRENWKTVRHAFDYFLVLQDWACMATGYCESGIAWNDGNNYGGYVGFVRMAEILGDDDSRDLGMYAFSKLTAMRLAQFRSTQKYFHRFFGVAPWWIAKCFNEETDAGMAFTNVPDLVGQWRMQGIYNMTTEGHYPEAWEWYSRMLPAEVKELLATVNSSCGDIFAPRPEGVPPAYSSYDTVFGEQELFSYLMLALFTGFYSPEKLMSLLDKAAGNHLLSEQHLGSSLRSHRRVPAKWAYCFLKSQVQANAFPAWLTGWYGTRIETAEYDSGRNIATIRLAGDGKDGWIELGLGREPIKITGDGREIPVRNIERTGQLLKIKVDAVKILQLLFS